MTNEADNFSGLPQTTSENPSWKWLSDRIPSAAADRLSQWVGKELEELEAQFAEFVTERSLKRDLRNEFSQSKRGV